MTNVILRPKQVYSMVGLSPMQVWRLRRDGRFPQPIVLGVNSKGFLKNEIDEWIAARVAERDPQLTAQQTISAQKREPPTLNNKTDNQPSTAAPPNPRSNP